MDWSEVDDAWLSQACGHSVSIRSMEETAGAGWTSQVRRIGLADGTTLIVKLGRDNESLFDDYEAEARFYRELAPDVPLRIPHCHLATVDRGALRAAFVLEDVGGLHPRGGLDGPLLLRLLDDLAQHQARFWQSHRLEAWGLAQKWGSPAQAERKLHRISEDIHQFAERVFVPSPELDAAVSATLADFPNIYRRMDALPCTLVHADLHAANMLVQGDRVGIIDWSEARADAWPVDVAAVIGGAAVESADAPGLLVVFGDSLARHGGPNLTLDELWQGYSDGLRRFTLWEMFFLSWGKANGEAVTDSVVSGFRRLANALCALTTTTGIDRDRTASGTPH